VTIVKGMVGLFACEVCMKKKRVGECLLVSVTGELEKEMSEGGISIRETREGWPSAHSLKLRQMGTQGVHMKGVLSWLVRWAPRAGTRDFCPALFALVGPVQNIFFTPDSILLCRVSPLPS
jgi:hypothetical protein